MGILLNLSMTMIWVFAMCVGLPGREAGDGGGEQVNSRIWGYIRGQYVPVRTV